MSGSGTELTQKKVVRSAVSEQRIFDSVSHTK